MFDPFEELEKMMQHRAENCKPGEKLADLKAAEKADWEQITAKWKGIVKEAKRIERAKQRLLLERDEWWEGVRDSHDIKKSHILIEEGQVFEAV